MSRIFPCCDMVESILETSCRDRFETCLYIILSFPRKWESRGLDNYTQNKKTIIIQPKIVVFHKYSLALIRPWIPGQARNDEEGRKMMELKLSTPQIF